MTTPSGIPDPAYHNAHRDNEKVDLLKKIAGLLSALVALALISVILQVVGLVLGNQTSNEISDRLDDIRSNTAVVNP